MLEQILMNIGLISPIFLLVVFGIFLRQINFIDEAFIKKTTNFVFKFCLPALIFEKLSVTSFTAFLDFSILYFSLFITISEIGIAWILAKKIAKKPEDKGVFVQGAYRSNLAIIGFAVLANFFGDAALTKASLLIAFTMPLYNFLGVVVLMLPHEDKFNFNFKKFGKQLILNPLILSVIVSLPISYAEITLPEVLKTFIHYLSVMALPLALIDIGATINFKYLLSASGMSFVSSGLKIIVFPLIFIPIAYLLGARGIDLAVLYILCGSPTAIASFPMAGALKGNLKMAGNVIVITTLLSAFTISFGFAILRYFNML